MARLIWILILSVTLHGCGSDSEDTPPTAPPDSVDADWPDENVDNVVTGSLAINLPAEQGSGRAMCSLNITRIVEKRLANVILMLDVIGEGCDVTGRCDDPNMSNGDFNLSGGIDGDQPFAMMALGYEPPSDSEEEPLWAFDVIFNSAPSSSFDMWVDGEPFNLLTSDTRSAEDFSKGPHEWNVKIDVEADMMQAPAASEASLPGVQARGTFSYEGPCQIAARYIQP